MKNRFSILMISIIFCLCAGFVSAEIYKYVDTEGKIHFTDAPPVGVEAQPLDIQPNVYKVGGRTTSKQAVDDNQENVSINKTQPKVELFVTSWCGYCKKAEAYLRKKGIAFTAFDIEKDLRAARRKDSLTSRKGVPFALIGDQKVTGFSEFLYDSALQKAR